MRVLDGVEDIAVCRFTGADVVRHALVQKIISAYEKYEKSREPDKRSAPGRVPDPGRRKKP
jgi:phosphate starvation-inducible PhoH-like protein